MSRIYDDSSISALKGAERVRTRPAVMFGTDGIEGARHTVIEILGNALDEASSGYGDKIEVVYYEDGAVSVRDYGRGVPLGWNENEGRYNWDLIYNELYAGGKYDDSQTLLSQVRDWNTFDVKQFSYLFSVGLNGLGAASTQYTSRYCEVRSYRNGECSTMRFEKGFPILEELEITTTDEANGTFVKWLPDDDVFSNTDLGGDWLYNTCLDVLNISGLTFDFTNRATGEHRLIEGGGLSAVLENTFSNSIAYRAEDGTPVAYQVDALTHGNATVKGKPSIYVCKLDMMFTFIKTSKRHNCFHNLTWMKDGAQYQAIDSAIREFYQDKASASGIKLEYTDFSESIGVVVSSYSNVASYQGQTKNEIDNAFVYSTVRDSLLTKLNTEYGKGTKQLLDSVSSVINNAITRIQIKEYAKQVKQASKATREKPDKFVECKSYIDRDVSISELWITEGDSALTAVKRARNSDFQALFPVRGKILNVLKQPMGRILKNDIVKGVFALLETGMDLGHEDLFDISKLRFDKIIFATDADEDGFQIRVLLFLLFYRLAPALLRQGHVYIAETPLFEIKLSNGDRKYAFNNAKGSDTRGEQWFSCRNK